MDKCTKFKIFNVTLLFCVFNFFIYRFFAYPGASSFLVSPKNILATKSQSNTGRNTHETHLVNNILHSPGGPPSPSHDLGVQNNKGSKDLSKNNKSESLEKVLKSPQEEVSPKQSNSKSPTRTGSNTTKAISNIHALKADFGKVTPTPKPPVPYNASHKNGETAVKVTEGSNDLCPLIPPKLSGSLATYMDTSISFEKIAEINPLLKPGGRYKPSECVARHRVAIVIPYRNREQHLRILLHNLHPMLQRQQLDYGIFVIEEELPTRFNRAMLMNIGFVEAMKIYDYQCAIFHDVDLIPENDHNIYSCPQMPRHLSAAIDKFKYRLPYPAIYGGVSAMTKEHMQKVNGFSNLFFGWGGEDDDMAARIKAKGLKISRYPMTVARYRMIKHSGKESGNEPNPQRYALLKDTASRMDKDGLNTLKYTVKKVVEFPTYTNILVYINEDDFKT